MLPGKMTGEKQFKEQPYVYEREVNALKLTIVTHLYLSSYSPISLFDC